MHLFHLKIDRQIYRGNLVIVCTTTTNIPTVKNNIHIIIDEMGTFIVALTIYTISRPKSSTSSNVGNSYVLYGWHHFPCQLSKFTLTFVSVYVYNFLVSSLNNQKNAKLEPNSISTAASSQSSCIFRRFRWYNSKLSTKQLLFFVTATTIFIGNWTNDF